MAKKFGHVLSPQKVKKHSKNDLTAPILTQEAVLGELTFGGVNGGQMEKFHLSWKVDRHKFTISKLGANLELRKAYKSGSKQVLHIENQALRIKEKLPV